jgi:acetyl esterase/lipase
MMVHGGGWSGGDKGEFSQAAQRLAGSGYVGATINYRLTPAGQYPADVKDCLCALAFLRSNADTYRVDSARVAAWGYSSGGQLVALIGAAASDPALVPDCDAAGQQAVPGPAAVVAGSAPLDLRGSSSASDYLGGSPNAIPNTYALASPITRVHNGMPPYLFVNGDEDALVDYTSSRVMRDAMLVAGDDATQLLIGGGGHVLNVGVSGSWIAEEADLTPEAWIAEFAFFERILGRSP